MALAAPALTQEQQAFWRRWVGLNTGLSGALNRRLQEHSGLSLQDFEVLRQLHDSPRRRVRIRDLAQALGWERSRLSHHLTRMVNRGLVERTECHDDGRGAFELLTTAGATALECAAPAHAAIVNDLLFEGLGPDELDVLLGFTARVLGRLATADQATADQATGDQATGDRAAT